MEEDTPTYPQPLTKFSWLSLNSFQLLLKKFKKTPKALHPQRRCPPVFVKRGEHSGSATYWACDTEQGTQLLQASFFSTAKLRNTSIAKVG